jgi:ADP-ribosylglycohydrolase
MDRVAAMDRWAHHYIDDFAGALWTAVSRFGDCDTPGAVVGGIVALGHSAIPVEWRQRREPLATMLRLTGP